MADEEVKRNMIALLSSALRGEKAEINCDEKILFGFCQYHKVAALASMALEKPDEKWIKAKVEAIRRTAIFDHERSGVLESLEKEKVWYCPLKGIVLKEFYPEYGIREMSDNDILVDKSKMDTVREVMLDNGFEFINAGNINHEVFHKKPVCNFEMHKALFNEVSGKGFISYYDHVKDRLIKDDGNEYGYHFSDEDFYIYFIVHNHKHLRRSGSGVRTLVDIYVYLKKKTLDMAYVKKQLETLGIAEEERLLRSIAFKIFENGQALSEEESRLLDYVLSSGVYGNQGNYILNALNSYREKTRYYRLYYIYRRMFPSEETLKYVFPFFYRHVWARPFLLVYRLTKALIKRHKGIIRELKTLRKKADHIRSETLPQKQNKN